MTGIATKLNRIANEVVDLGGSNVGPGEVFWVPAFACRRLPVLRTQAGDGRQAWKTMGGLEDDGG